MERLSHAFCKEAHGRQLGDEKVQPNKPLENPQGWRPQAVNLQGWGLCRCPCLPRMEA